MYASLQKSIQAGALLRRVPNIRSFSSPADYKPPKECGPVCPKFKAEQEFYTDPNNTAPIYIKRGTRDKVLFYITVALTGLGFANVIKRVYERGLY